LHAVCLPKLRDKSARSVQKYFEDALA
jgi:hypothetical protein